MRWATSPHNARHPHLWRGLVRCYDPRPGDTGGVAVDFSGHSPPTENTLSWGYDGRSPEWANQGAGDPHYIRTSNSDVSILDGSRHVACVAYVRQATADTGINHAILSSWVSSPFGVLLRTNGLDLTAHVWTTAHAGGSLGLSLTAGKQHGVAFRYSDTLGSVAGWMDGRKGAGVFAQSGAISGTSGLYYGGGGRNSSEGEWPGWLGPLCLYSGKIPTDEDLLRMTVDPDYSPLAYAEPWFYGPATDSGSPAFSARVLRSRLLRSRIIQGVAS